MNPTDEGDDEGNGFEVATRYGGIKVSYGSGIAKMSAGDVLGAKSFGRN